MESEEYNFPIDFWGEEHTLDGVTPTHGAGSFRLPVIHGNNDFRLYKITVTVFNNYISRHKDNLYVFVYSMNKNITMDIGFKFEQLPLEFIEYDGSGGQLECNHEFKLDSIFTETEFNTLISLIENNVCLFKKTISSRINHLLNNEYDNSIRSVSSCE